MADEPTGALDSATGKQVLDTLKKLSKDKLVIVVSHDREFAEKYADRVIELADGAVISDIEYSEDIISEAGETGISFEDNKIVVASGYHLTEEDRVRINEYLDSLAASEAVIGVRGYKSTTRAYRKTDQNSIRITKDESFKLIKSKIPLRSAIKIGANGLKYKKIRLVITIILSCIAFGLFGLADTIGAYNHIETCTESIIDSNIKYASVEKAIRYQYQSDDFYYYSGMYRFTEDEIKDFAKETDVEMEGVYAPLLSEMDFYENIGDIDYGTGFDIYPTYFTGFAQLDEGELSNYGYKVLCGKLPDGSKNEIGISDGVYETFVKYGYSDGSYTGEKKNTVAIGKYEDIIGKSLKFNQNQYVITCVVDTGLDFERYEGLAEEPENMTSAEEIIRYALYSELSYTQRYSFEQAAIVGEGFINRSIANEPDVKIITKSIDIEAVTEGDEYLWFCPSYVGELKSCNQSDINWIDGPKESLGEKEIIISDVACSGMFYENGVAINDVAKIAEQIKKCGESFSINSYEAEFEQVSGYKIVGIIKSNYDMLIAHPSLIEEVSKHGEGHYSYAVGVMPTEYSEVKDLVAKCYSEDDDVRHELRNAVTYELDTVNSVFEDLSVVFLYIGIGFALFSALMLANFISTSISYKKQEIGILRAIGARSNDVFKIY